MNQQTNVRNFRIKKPGRMDVPTPQVETSASKYQRKRKKVNFQKADQLFRHFAVAGCLLLTIVAIGNIETSSSQSVFAVIQTGVNMDWDETLGKLQFVDNFLPESIQAVWSEQSQYVLMSPVTGTVVHAWSESEPYISLDSVAKDVHSVADGEIMNIAHGLDEERIVRIRHDDDTEAVYGNLAECYGEEGDRVYAGDVFGRILDDEPLAFEFRQDGLSVAPSNISFYE